MKPRMSKKTLLMAAALIGALTTSQAFADHGRRVVVREAHYAAPILTYHSGPVSVYVGSAHNTQVITTTHRPSYWRTSHDHRNYRKHHGHQDSYGRHHGRDHKKSHKRNDGHYGSRHHSDYRYSGYHRMPSRGSWSDGRREVIYVDKDARKRSNYRRVERNSVVIRERRR
ncbi:hypothetical protein [Pseudohongiella acticola]|nr:hypothetical protein [Pseudohongiella acticola]